MRRRCDRRGHEANRSGHIYPGVYGEPAAIADGLRPYIDLGFRTFVALLPAPFDRETIDRISEVRAHLDG